MGFAHIERVWATLRKHELEGFTGESVKKVRGKDLFDVRLKAEAPIGVDDLLKLELAFASTASVESELEYHGCPCCEYDPSAEVPYIVVVLNRATLAEAPPPK